MDEQIDAVTDHLRPLLLEARNLMNLQDRAIASGIRIDNSFVRQRVDGWDEAILAARETFAGLLTAKIPDAAGLPQNGP